MNILIPILAALLAATSPTTETKEQAQYRRSGGFLVQRGTYTGKIGILNAGGSALQCDAEQAASTLKSALQLNIYAAACESTDPAAALKASGADAAVVIVNRPDTPELLLAPNDRWAQVNVAKIVNDLPTDKAKDRFRSPRVRKQIIRAFCALLGGASSQYPGNIMNAISTRELDLFAEQLPVDVIDRIEKHCRHLNITPAEYTTYKIACRQGWAPAPTNDVQKAIWDKVHAVPQKPMKIEFDPKKGR